MKKNKGPKVLILDIETSPIISYTWGIWDQNVGLNQIKQDWNVIAWAAKWLDEPASKIIYKDQRSANDIHNDKQLLRKLWDLLDKADIIVTQNGKAFDEKKLNARFILQGFQPPSSFKHIDTKQIAKKKFGFTSNKLEYLSENLCNKYKKLTKRKFAGFELWKECLARNLNAWKEMEKYNKLDILSLEELYKKLIPWDNSINFSLYSDDLEYICSCGHTKLQKNGVTYTAVGRYQRYRCGNCGKEVRGSQNLLTKEKRKSIMRRS